jgi:hypothetical protein
MTRSDRADATTEFPAGPTFLIGTLFAKLHLQK